MFRVLEDKFKNIPKTVASAFLSSLVFGFLAHYFIMTTKLTNHDDIRQTCDEMVDIKWGRWLLAYASDISGNMSMPFNCFLATVFIAAAAAFVVSALNLRSVVSAGLVGALMATAPAITFNNLYVSTSDPYALAILLMTAGACVAVKARNKVISVVVPVILFTASLGIYQAFLGLALGIFILCGISALLYEGRSFKPVLFEEIRYLVTSVGAAVLYIILTKVIQNVTGIEADNYQGMDSMGTVDVGSLPYLIRLAYTKSLGYYLLNSNGVHYRFLAGLFIIMCLAAAVIFILRLIKIRPGILETVLVIILAGLLPMAAGVIYIMGAGGIHLLMTYSFLTLAFFPLLLSDRLELSVLSGNAMEGIKLYERIFQGILLCTLGIAVFDYTTLANKVYTVDYYVYEESYAYAQTVVSAIRRTPGFDRDSTVYMVGEPKSRSYAVDEFFEDDPRIREFDGSAMDRDFGAVYSMPSFYWYYMGLSNPVRVIGQEKAADLGAGDMTVFPEPGSIYAGDGFIVVRFD